MFLLVLDKDPKKSAQLVPKKLKFKQLLELCQLVCSAGISNVYKPVKQGKKIQEWILKNKIWIYKYLHELFFWWLDHSRFNIKTLQDISKIEEDVIKYIGENKRGVHPRTAIFRYSKDYISDIPSNSELPIEICIKEYERYIDWKRHSGVKGYEQF